MFGQRRKARVITVTVEDGEDSGEVRGPVLETAGPGPRTNPKPGKKTFRPSGLRNTYNRGDDDGAEGRAEGEAGEDDGPVVVRGGMSRPGLKKKEQKKPPPRAGSGTYAEEDPEQGDLPGAQKDKRGATPGQRAVESGGGGGLRKNASLRALPVRSHDTQDASRPIYSKEYLDELRSSTPNTPQNMASTPISGDELGLVFDASELDGALVMQDTDLAPPPRPTLIPTDAEIRERKERRARIATESRPGEGDYISFDDSGDDGRRKKKESRLVGEDEDLGEGFDNFVEDGGVAVGKKASKAARRRKRKEMAEMIRQAEGNSDSDSSESEAGRRAAYETAQARAGMDGLKRDHRRQQDQQQQRAGTGSEPADGPQVPARITPLPELGACLARLRERVAGMGHEVRVGEARIAELERERAEVLAREAEVQRLLDEAGERYRTSAGLGVGAAGPHTAAGEYAGERGLESLGTAGGVGGDADEEMD